MLPFLIKTENTVTRLKNMINIDKQTKYKTRDKNRNDARAIGPEGKRKNYSQVPKVRLLTEFGSFSIPPAQNERQPHVD